jgi:hypothetical protein
MVEPLAQFLVDAVERRRKPVEPVERRGAGPREA